jgi:hypothetical protein
MNNTKYVIVEGSAIVFSTAIQHKDMVGRNQKCQGAGFVDFNYEVDEDGNNIMVSKCYGMSISLDIKSREEEDSVLINRQILNNSFM